MNYIGKFFSNFKDAYNEINTATLTGAIDAVVVRQEDGTYISSPFHVRFGKIGVLRSREKVVDIEINGQAVDIRMKLGENGEAFFVEEVEEGDEVGSFFGTSPLPSYADFGQREDDIRSQDSGVGAEEILSKSLKQKAAKEQVTLGADLSVSSNFEHHILDEGSSTLPSNQDCVEDYTSDTSQTIFNQVLVERVETEFLEDNFEKQGLSQEIVPSVSDVSGDLSHWGREELVRSKSLNFEPSLLQKSSSTQEGQGSKTDIEEAISRNSRRRRRKRASSRKHRTKGSESHSSENSTTSETMDLSSLSVTGIVSGAHDPIFHMDDFEHYHDNEVSSLHPEAGGGENVPYDTSWSDSRSRTMGHDFHPFSDTDISPPPSRGNSRSHTPVKSDTEYECEKQKSELNQKSSQSRDSKWSWTWGELPTPPQSAKANSFAKHGLADVSKEERGDTTESLSRKDEAQRSMLGSMFNFMRATRKARRNPEDDGIYLEDLKLDELEPEVAALYFPRNSILEKGAYTGFRSVAKDEDAESGNGTSLPQSPHSVEGAIGGLKISDSDFEDSAPRHRIFDYKGYHDLALSLCGCLHDHVDEPFPESLFMQSLITYDEFCENPDVMYNPNLVVRFNGKYLNWATAAPQILSLVLFQRPLPQKVIDNLALDNMPKKEMRKRTASRGYSWFSWGSRQSEDSSNKARDEKSKLSQISGGKPGESEVAATLTEASVGEAVADGITSTGVQEINEAREQVKSRLRTYSSGSEDHDIIGRQRRFRKTMRLSDEQIKKLNLRCGSNEAVFSVTTAYQGTTSCKCHVFLWNHDEKIVISDIDGTITKSDVLGHILPIIGKDWAQGGVAQLFTKIKNNGYNFLYLSARAIGQARITRDYLRSIRQGDVSLPDGPLLLNPTSLIQAFHREVIEKKPEEFKISCLRDIRALFPADKNPFYAGYGNRVNDVWAYSAVGIPISRIFTINHRGELKHELTQAFQTTYSNLSDIAHHMFPPNEETVGEFSSFQYWRPPLPDYSTDIDAEINQIVLKGLK